MATARTQQIADTRQGVRALSIARHSVPNPWRTWVAENLVLGIDAEEITQTLIGANIPEPEARAEVESAISHPYVKAAQHLAAKLQKLESCLNVHRAMGELSYGVETIERRSQLSEAEFLERYYAANRPVILTGMLAGNAAFSRWTPKYMRDTCGDAQVEIMAGRDKDPDYEVNSTQHKSKVPFRDYIDQVLSGRESNDYYLVANNGFFTREETKALYDDLPRFQDYLDPEKAMGQVFFWFGPAGTVTPLHHDIMNVLVAQLLGRKRFILISPDQTHLVYNNIAVYSAVDCEKPDYERFPRFRDAKAITCVLRRGEVLFLPVGWWHHVRALDVSMGVSYTNFKYPNHFEWSEPDIRW
jgi:hypothetical protein